MDKSKMSFEEFSSLYAYKKENGSYTISYVRAPKKEMIISIVPTENPPAKRRLLNW